MDWWAQSATAPGIWCWCLLHASGVLKWKTEYSATVPIYLYIQSIYHDYLVDTHTFPFDYLSFLENSSVWCPWRLVYKVRQLLPDVLQQFICGADHLPVPFARLVLPANLADHANCNRCLGASPVSLDPDKPKFWFLSVSHCTAYVSLCLSASVNSATTRYFTFHRSGEAWSTWSTKLPASHPFMGMYYNISKTGTNTSFTGYHKSPGWPFPDSDRWPFHRWLETVTYGCKTLVGLVRLLWCSADLDGVVTSSRFFLRESDHGRCTPPWTIF
jgi:hypothetical protein